MLTTASGTVALTLALQQSGSGRPPFVALPAFACPDVGTAAVAAGAHIALYDVNPDTLQPDWDSVHAALALGASHLVVTHLFGRLVDVARAQQLSEEVGAVLIEDAAQHAGASLGGVRAGGLADWGVLSFGRGKGINAGGGGALLVRDASVLEQLSLSPPSAAADLRQLAVAAAGELLAHPLVYGVPSALPWLHLGDTTYHPPVPPAGTSRVQLTLLAAALNAEPLVVAARRAVEAWYEQVLADRPQLLFAPPLEPAHRGALRFPVRLSPLAAAPLARYGVARSYPRTLDAYPPLRERMPATLPPCPGAAQLAATTHTLPTHTRASLATREHLVRALRAGSDPSRPR